MTSSPETTAVGTIAGAAAGASGGLIAGPPGVVAGALVGAAVGAMAGAALGADQQEKVAAEEALDREIGIIGGDIGVAPPDQPPPKVGAYSAGIGPALRQGDAEPPAEGPLPPTGPDKP